MQTIDGGLTKLYRQGIITREVAEKHAQDKRAVLSGGLGGS